tara:strand:+ start:5409 stop:6494 length:1086 start_codon:yes stop_codon:yes gene_type:complete
VSKVVLPVDRLAELWPLSNSGDRVGALLHGASTTSALVPTLHELERLNGDRFHLHSLFGPQHGFSGTTQDNMIEWEGFQHPRLNIPVYSLYGEHREPSAAMLEGLDALFVDLVDVGARYYTFIWTLFLCMKACEKAGIHVIVADRPNPINGVTIEGEPQDSEYLSFVGLHPIPVRHGKTIGQLATQFQAEVFPDCKLTVLPLDGWDPESYFEDTGLPWIMPSPNMPTVDTAVVYPGMCLLEGSNLSEGRGTTRPFELFGAPWIDSEEYVDRLNRLGLAGCHFRPVNFEPTFQKHARKVCGGAQLHVTERGAFQPLETAIQILTVTRERYDSFAWNPPPYEYEEEKLPIEILLGGPVENTFP